MKKYFLEMLLTAITAIIISCGENGVDPEAQSGRRDYVWSVDTVKVPFNYLNRLWGSSPIDIWATGPGGGLDQTIWHYDGFKWKTDGISRAISPHSIRGFGANDIWIGGSSGMIWHYDGNQFKANLDYRPTPDWNKSEFKDFCGVASTDMYSIGFLFRNNQKYGIIFHRAGSNWQMENILSSGDEFMQIKKGDNDPNYYLWSWRLDNIHPDSVRVYSYNGSVLNELYRGLMDDTHGAGLETINGEVYCGRDNSVYKIKNGKFYKQFDVNNPQFIQALNGRNGKDIFLWMWDGVAHYDGSTVEYIYKTNSQQTPRDLIVFDNEVVILFDDVSKGLSLVVTGKLK